MIATSEQTENGLVNLVVRWGDQSRLKCADCTCYLRFPQSDKTVQCSRCGRVYEHIEGDTFRRVVEDTEGG